MDYRIKEIDGPARLGELSLNKKKIVTPNIFFVNTDRFKAPKFAEITQSENERKSDSYHILLNAIQLYKQSKKFVEHTINLKEEIGYENPIYLPAVGEPSNLALLTYLGFDLFDSISAIINARNGILFFTNENINKSKLYELPCNCPACTNYKGSPSEMKFEDILNHNYYMMLNEIKNVRNSITNGKLRHLVETRIKSSPHLSTILRFLDVEYYDFLEKHTPVTGKNLVLATSKETFNRPEIKRFQERVINRYSKPKSSKILLLLPCSAKKPYSFSESHKRFREVLSLCSNPNIIHEVIVTSPMGLVPRELELVYPASNYDIPVTGRWDEDEKKMIRELLKEYLKKNKYDKIIVHLPSEITSFIEGLLKNPIITCDNKPTSKDSLQTLSKTLEKVVKGYEKIKLQDRRKEDMLGSAAYQFDKKIAEKLLDESIVRGRYPNQKVIKENKQLGMVTGERGLISLTIDGAKRLLGEKMYWAELYGGFTLKGSVFAPGVKDADENIRIGDEVVIKRGKQLLGVGVAMMNGEQMKKVSHGEAIKTRHHV